MQQKPNPSINNPLKNFMRQPKLYIKLPTNGEFWPAGSISIPENQEFPVYSMTARDELLFKTPDALLNGQAIVDVVQSCLPNIKNAWDCPTLDLDVILIAIRLATYGEKMTVSHTVPVIKEEVEYELDLTRLLDQQSGAVWTDQVVVNPELIVYVKPLTYRHLTKTNIKSFETNRILNMVNDDSIPDEEKIKIFQSSFSNLTQLTVDLLAESIYKIDAGDVSVTESKFILEFIANADSDVFNKVQKHLTDLKEQNSLKPLQFATTPEQQAEGAPAEYSIPINFNNSDFFARGF